MIHAHIKLSLFLPAISKKIYLNSRYLQNNRVSCPLFLKNRSKYKTYIHSVQNALQLSICQLVWLLQAKQHIYPHIPLSTPSVFYMPFVQNTSFTSRSRLYVYVIS